MNRRAMSVYLILTLIWFLSQCSGKPKDEDSGKIIIAASILPLADFTEQIGGKYVDVDVLVPPGSSPHTYEPKPAQLKRLSRAKVLILNGIGLEFWEEKVVSSVNNTELLVIHTAEGLDIINEIHDEEENQEAGDEHEEEHSHSGGNPHVWLDPVNVIHQVERIYDVLVKINPGYTDYFTTNKNNYINALKSLDEEIKNKIEQISDKKIITFHSGYDYFIKRYGFEKVAVLEESPGKESTPAKITQVIQLIKKHNIKVIFAEPQFSPKVAQVIADESNAQIAFLDPLGKEKDYSYIKLMKSNLEQLEKFLK